jgi:16S rRNA pseudouridine516 synthase
MFEAVGKKVLYLRRVSMGPLLLDPALAPGEWRELTEDEVDSLRNYRKDGQP